MLIRIRQGLIGSDVQARDGQIGHVTDVFFEDTSWVVRYLVVDTGHWLPGRRVLLVPDCTTDLRPVEHELHVDLTRDQVHDSPEIDTRKPISRQQELDLHMHYSWGPYWPPAAPIAPVPAPEPSPPNTDETAEGPRLRSMEEVTGYHISTRDGQVGHVEDLLADTDGWAIRYLEVDTRNWLPAKHVLLPPEWIMDIVWAQRIVSVGMLKDAIRDAPEYEPGEDVTRAYEERLHAHYGRRGYW